MALAMQKAPTSLALEERENRSHAGASVGAGPDKQKWLIKLVEHVTNQLLWLA